MTITVSPGRDPATTSIRQNCLDGSYTYLETTYGPTELAALVSDLTAELSRLMRYRASPPSQSPTGEDD